MATEEENNKSVSELAGKDLFNFALNRDDIKTLVAHLPKETECRPETVEYELQILKIISIGWSISFFLAHSPNRDQLSELYWRSIHDFSQTLSETSQMMTGKDIDYFQVLKERLDMYVLALSEKPDATDLAAVIGPEFAGVCGNSDDVFAVLAGSRIFNITVTSVKDYLESVEFE